LIGNARSIRVGNWKMKRLLTFALLFFAIYFAFSMPALALGSAAKNLTERSQIDLSGYMDETQVFQTDSGFAGTKLSSGTRGSGHISRTQYADVFAGPNYDETTYTEDVTADYKPYTLPPTMSDLKNALCAKNYEVGSVFSESYTNIQSLIKDTNIYQDKNDSVYQIGSYASGTTKMGTIIRKNADTVPAYVMGGTYIGDLNIHLEIQTGNFSILSLPCP
jgi:hypothetical protein